jgi:hypothetical protein
MDPAKGYVQPAQFTCPRSTYNPPSYPAGSDGTAAGMKDSGADDAGAGFPFANCDGLYSPLRADLHFPSCYDPSKALNDYQHNMVWPSDAGNGKQDCPKGFVHVPHLFYEMYWDTQRFQNRWTPNQGRQPFVLANGDTSGYSLHGDFMAAWDTTILQHIIDTCNVGSAGMDTCPGNIGAVNNINSCKITSPISEQVDGILHALPGNNPLFGYGAGTTSISTTINKSSTPSTLSGYKYAGCYHDSSSARALTGIQFANPGSTISNTNCVSYCRAQGYSMAATEYAGQCFCGNQFNTKIKIDESKCNMRCAGDSTQICGGPDALSVYTKTGTA